MNTQLSLTTGQITRVFWDPHVGRGSEPTTAFKARLNYLREQGVPFPKNEQSPGSGANLEYGFDHLSELALALELIMHCVKPGDAAEYVVSYRDQLRPMFREAYDRKDEVFSRKEAAAREVKGLFMEATLQSIDGRSMVRPPKLFAPDQCLRLLDLMNGWKSASLIVPISALLDYYVGRAQEAPEIKRGRPTGRTSGRE